MTQPHDDEAAAEIARLRSELETALRGWKADNAAHRAEVADVDRLASEVAALRAEVAALKGDRCTVCDDDGLIYIPEHGGEDADEVPQACPMCDGTKSGYASSVTADRDRYSTDSLKLRDAFGLLGFNTAAPADVIHAEAKRWDEDWKDMNRQRIQFMQERDESRAEAAALRAERDEADLKASGLVDKYADPAPPLTVAPAVPASMPAVCPVCEWSNGDLMNYGTPGNGLWMCHGCAARAVQRAAQAEPRTAHMQRDIERWARDACNYAKDGNLVGAKHFILRVLQACGVEIASNSDGPPIETPLTVAAALMLPEVRSGARWVEFESPTAATCLMRIHNGQVEWNTVAVGFGDHALVSVYLHHLEAECRLVEPAKEQAP